MRDYTPSVGGKDHAGWVHQSERRHHPAQPL